jgi:hypothetical protein
MPPLQWPVIAPPRTLQRGIAFVDLGGNYLDSINKHRTAKRLVRRLNRLGYEVMLRPQAAA